MKRNTVIALVVATGLAATGYGIAVAQTGPAGPGPGRPGQRFRAIPDLTESQRTDIRTLMSEHREAGADQRQKLQEMHTQLNAEVFGDAPNIGRIEELKMEIAGLQADMLSSRIESETRLASLLTPEQRAAMRERAAERPRMSGPRRRGPRRR